LAAWLLDFLSSAVSTEILPRGLKIQPAQCADPLVRWLRNGVRAIIRQAAALGNASRGFFVAGALALNRSGGLFDCDPLVLDAWGELCGINLIGPRYCAGGGRRRKRRGLTAGGHGGHSLKTVALGLTRPSATGLIQRGCLFVHFEAGQYFHIAWSRRGALTSAIFAVRGLKMPPLLHQLLSRLILILHTALKGNFLIAARDSARIPACARNVETWHPLLLRRCETGLDESGDQN
jgi:hypothetical protein